MQRDLMDFQIPRFLICQDLLRCFHSAAKQSSAALSMEFRAGSILLGGKDGTESY